MPTRIALASAASLTIMGIATAQSSAMTLSECVLNVSPEMQLRSEELFDSSLGNNFDEILPKLTEAVQLGNSRAANRLAVIYRGGEITPADPVKARYFYEKSANCGYAPAQYNLSRVLHLGVGGPVDIEGAYYWAEQAANQGYGLAQYELGTKFEKGEGVEPNLAQAIVWYLRAARTDHEASMVALSELYAVEGPLQDLDAAAMWSARASENASSGDTPTSIVDDSASADQTNNILSATYTPETFVEEVLYQLEVGPLDYERFFDPGFVELLSRASSSGTKFTMTPEVFLSDGGGLLSAIDLRIETVSSDNNFSVVRVSYTSTDGQEIVQDLTVSDYGNDVLMISDICVKSDEIPCYTDIMRNHAIGVFGF